MLVNKCDFFEINLVFSTIPALSDNKALKRDGLVITTSEEGNFREHMKAAELRVESPVTYLCTTSCSLLQI